MHIAASGTVPFQQEETLGELSSQSCLDQLTREAHYQMR